MNHYIYEITNNINNKKYIGKRSCKCKIEEDKYMGSGVAITRARKKYGKENFSKRIIEILNSEEEAFEREKYWIAYYDAVKSRMYYNIKDGGEGNTREDMLRIMSNMTDEQKKTRSKKLSIANKGKNNSMYGKTGKENPVSKAIVMISEKGKVEKEFECIRQANDYLKKDRAVSYISRICLEKCGSAYGYLWLFKNDYNNLITNNKFNNWLNINLDSLQKKNLKKHIYCEKSVYMLSINTYEILKKFDNIQKASKKIGIPSKHILRNCNHGCNTAGGSSWIFVEEYNKLNKEEIYTLFQYKYTPHSHENHFKQKVVCITTNQIFNSIKEAIAYFNLCRGARIDAVCTGKRKTAGKLLDGTSLKWMYYNEYIKQNQLLIHNENIGQAI